MEIILFCAYCCFSASWMVGSILTTEMAQDFGIAHLPASVNNAISAAKIVGNFVAAWIIIKFNPKRTVSLSILLIMAVTVGALATNLPLFVITRFLLGFGGAVLMISMTPYVVYLFDEKRQPIFIGINNAGPNTGNLIALLSINAVRHWLVSWRFVILFYAIFSVVFLLLWMAYGKNYPITEKTEEDHAAIAAYGYRDGLKEPFLYKFLFTLTGRLVMYTVMLYLFPLNPSFTVDAQFITLMIAITGVPGTVLGIILAKKVQNQSLLFKIAGFAQTAVFLLMIVVPSPTVATLCAVLLGCIIFLSTPALFTLPTRLPGATPRMVAVIMTLYWSMAYILQMAVYAFIVYLVNHWGWNQAMLFTAFYSLTFFIGSFILPDLRPPKKEM